MDPSHPYDLTGSQLQLYRAATPKDNAGQHVKARGEVKLVLELPSAPEEVQIEQLNLSPHRITNPLEKEDSQVWLLDDGIVERGSVLLLLNGWG